MMFTENKKEDFYEYRCSDLFGDLFITSPRKLMISELDDILLIGLKNKSKAKHIEGDVLLRDDVEVNYFIIKKNQWQKIKK